MEKSDYVLVVVTVPESHAELMRQTMGEAGAGKIGNYSHCSFSIKGVGRFIPNDGAHPFLGRVGILEEVAEEQIEAICSRALLNQVLNEIKRVHPYEETIIGIYPVYGIGRKGGN